MIVLYEVAIGGRVRHVAVQRVDGQFRVAIDGRAFLVDAARVDEDTWSLLTMEDAGGSESAGPSRAASYEVSVTGRDRLSGEAVVSVGAVSVTASLDGRRRADRKTDGSQTGKSPAGGSQRIVAPMPGKVVRVLVGPGAAVRARQPLVVIEAMKMENELRASSDGIVAEIHATEGQSVEAGVLLAIVVAGTK